MYTLTSDFPSIVWISVEDSTVQLLSNELFLLIRFSLSKLSHKRLVAGWVERGTAGWIRYRGCSCGHRGLGTGRGIAN